MSEHVARLIVRQLTEEDGVETELIDIATLQMPVNDAGPGIRDQTFSSQMSAADALVIVVPEYNHSYPGLLKHVLDTCMEEYIHKAVGLVGVSAGPFGGTRAIQHLLPVMRELGLVTIFSDVNFGSVGRLFNASGELQEAAYIQRTGKFLKELIWMAETLRYGREHIALRS
jgi:NAD(P)H-dependent FMN reductase